VSKSPAAQNPCPYCRERNAYIRELERALAGAIWPKNSVTTAIRMDLCLSPQQANLVSALYDSRADYVSSGDLQMIMPAMYGKQEDRTAKYPNVVVCNVRKQLGKGFIETHAMGPAGLGFRLSKDARIVIDRIIKEREAV